MIATALFLAPRLDNPDLAPCLSGIFFRRFYYKFFIPNPFLEESRLARKPKWAWHDEGVAKIRTINDSSFVRGFRKSNQLAA